MTERGISFYLLNFALIIGSAFALEPMKFMHHTSLDPKGDFTIAWTPNDEGFTMEMAAKTSGYVSVGFSPNGGMTGSDIFIGWVADDGRVMGKDTYATGFDPPLVDKSQDYEVLGGLQNATHTVIRFQRGWDTCEDDGEDMKLNKDTVRVIWAFHEDDPEGDAGWKYHAANRGVRSVHLMEPAKPKMPYGKDVKVWDIIADNHVLPDDEDTYYGCQVFRVPWLTKKHQMIAFEPIIEPGHESYVHHIVLYECFNHASLKEMNLKTRDVFGPLVKNKKKADCASDGMPKEFGMCKAGILFVWAVGGEGEILPQEAGVPMCERWGGATYFLMEIHYDNPQMHKGVVDKSGLRVYYTDNVRPNDAGTVTFGALPDQTVVIPPNQEEYIQSSFCTEQCTSAGIPKEGLTAYNVLLHGHTAARKIRLRHIRDGKELPMIGQDNHYDFNYQSGRHINVTLMPGDSFITECEYNTMGRTGMTVGGESTKEEMCLAFVLVYPRPDLYICASAPTLGTQLTAMKMPWVYGEYKQGETEAEVSRDLWKKYGDTDWTELGDHFEVVNRFGNEYFICNGNGGNLLVMPADIPYPQFEWYEPKYDNMCENKVEN